MLSAVILSVIGTKGNPVCQNEAILGHSKINVSLAYPCPIRCSLITELVALMLLLVGLCQFAPAFVSSPAWVGLGNVMVMGSKIPC